MDMTTNSHLGICLLIKAAFRSDSGAKRKAVGVPKPEPGAKRQAKRPAKRQARDKSKSWWRQLIRILLVICEHRAGPAGVAQLKGERSADRSYMNIDQGCEFASQLFGFLGFPNVSAAYIRGELSRTNTSIYGLMFMILQDQDPNILREEVTINEIKWMFQDALSTTTYRLPYEVADKLLSYDNWPALGPKPAI